MTDLVGLVMEAAATELLYEEAAQIDRDVQQLLAEAERASAQERGGALVQRFLQLLQRRGEIARKAPVVFEGPRDRASTSVQHDDGGGSVPALSPLALK